MTSQNLGRLFTWPFRALSKLFRRGGGNGVKSGSPVRAAAKLGSGAVAKAAPGDILEQEYREDPPGGIEAAMFKQLPRPRLTEKAASELTIDEARNYAEQSSRFYDFSFPLFPRGDFFYEEIEEQYLNAALGRESESIDRRFIEVTTLFRRTLNDNTRRMLLFWAPFIGIVCFAAAAMLAPYVNVAGLMEAGPLAQYGAVYGAAALIAGFLTFVVYSWPYKVVQQRNLMNLDNYVTSKFARINNNFQVAKRRALNVERNKRMAEREALKEEAGLWTLSYHWFATRLFLCETMLRNKFYQVRRNTMLYWAAGGLLTLTAFAVFGAILWTQNDSLSALGVFAAAAFVYLAIAGAVLARAAGMMFAVLQTNEWSRFHLIDLDAAICDHVGEDKLQIITFRDRNRFE